MQKNPDGSVTLTKAEAQSLKKMLSSCHDAISQLPSDGDVLGWDNYRALQMWEDKFKGEKAELEWYIDEDEEEEGSKKRKPKTVDGWLEAYGRKRR